MDHSLKTLVQSSVTIIKNLNNRIIRKGKETIAGNIINSIVPLSVKHYKNYSYGLGLQTLLKNLENLHASNMPSVIQEVSFAT